MNSSQIKIKLGRYIAIYRRNKMAENIIHNGGPFCNYLFIYLLLILQNSHKIEADFISNATKKS